MRKMLLLMLAFLLVGCAGTKFYFFGFDVDNFKKMENEDWVKFGAGAVSVFAAHVGGHYLAAAIEGNEIRQDGMCEIYERETWLADNGGFLLQHGLGLFLTSFEGSRNWTFTKGYVATSALHTWTYPLVPKRESDFKDSHGNHLEMYGIYSAVGLHNLLRVNWGKEDEVLADRRNIVAPYSNWYTGE